jgi:hypothetical protein
MAHVVEGLTSKDEALSSTPVPPKKKNSWFMKVLESIAEVMGSVKTK